LIDSSKISRLLAPLLALALLLAATATATAGAAGEVRGFSAAKGARSPDSLIVTTDGAHSVVQIGDGQDLETAAQELARRPGVESVKPNYLARISEAPQQGSWIPNDRGRGTIAGAWQDLQWNFVGQWGVNVLPAWQKLRELGRAGGRGVTVAVVDTGVAYENRGRYRRSPDLAGVRIRRPYDFIGRDRHPNDANGHGTHVASTIFERTNNKIGVTGLAYGATLMPLRALNSKGLGDEMTVARAIRYAAKHHADVINLSVEFDVRLTASDLPTIVSAIRYAKRRGSLVVSAAGNQGENRVAFPARSGYALAVGATTVAGCLAEYSDYGSGLDLVAPGGGADTFNAGRSASSTDRDNCSVVNPALPIFQMTFAGGLRKFTLPSNYQGTSMAAPHVSGTAALVIASGVIGKDPSPVALQRHLQRTATELGTPGYDTRYGYGLVNAGRAVGAN
jgi:serine protease